MASIDPGPEVASQAICEVYELGLVPYPRAWRWQQQLLALHRQHPQPDRLLLLQHPPVYTLGQGSSLAHLRMAPEDLPYPLIRTERGGEVTHHCPGQLVGYPILNLRRHRPDLHWYLRQVEEVLILSLTQLGVAAHRRPGLTGVWLGDCKLAAIGIKVSRWVTMHGFALNVACDLHGFGAIVPCGLHHGRVGCLAEFCPGLTVDQVRPLVVAHFAQVFNLGIHYPPTVPWSDQSPGQHRDCNIATDLAPPVGWGYGSGDKAATAPPAVDCAAPSVEMPLPP